MNIFSENLVKFEKLDKSIINICSFNNLKCEFIQGKILSIENTNISFIWPHKLVNHI